MNTLEIEAAIKIFGERIAKFPMHELAADLVPQCNLSPSTTSYAPKPSPFSRAIMFEDKTGWWPIKYWMVLSEDGWREALHVETYPLDAMLDKDPARKSITAAFKLCGLLL